MYIKSYFLFVKVNHSCIFNIYRPYKPHKMSFSFYTIWNFDIQITVYMVLSQKKFAPLRSKGKPFFLVCLLWLYSFLQKLHPFFSSFKATEAKLSLDLPARLAEQFFSHQGLSTFYFQAMGGAKKNSRS